MKIYRKTGGIEFIGNFNGNNGKNKEFMFGYGRYYYSNGKNSVEAKFNGTKMVGELYIVKATDGSIISIGDPMNESGANYAPFI